MLFSIWPHLCQATTAHAHAASPPVCFLVGHWSFNSQTLSPAGSNLLLNGRELAPRDATAAWRLGKPPLQRRIEIGQQGPQSAETAQRISPASVGRSYPSGSLLRWCIRCCSPFPSFPSNAPVRRAQSRTEDPTSQLAGGRGSQISLSKSSSQLEGRRG